MGSLMAGWDANIKDPKDVMFQRNKSLTKEEIVAYWKSVKKPEEVNQNENQENMHSVSMKRYQKSNSLPLTDRRESSLNNGSKTEDEKKSKKSCWWTRSNWAFLNEPPVIATDGQQKYASQFHVAEFGSSETSTKSAQGCSICK